MCLVKPRAGANARFPVLTPAQKAMGMHLGIRTAEYLLALDFFLLLPIPPSSFD